MSKHKSLIQKMAQKVLFICSVLLILVIGIGITVFMPIYMNIEAEKASAATKYIEIIYENIQKKMVDSTYQLVTLNEFETLLNAFDNSPSEISRHKINLFLSQYQNVNDIPSKNIFFILVEDENDNTFSSISYSWSNVVTFIQNEPGYQKVINTRASYYSKFYKNYFGSAHSENTNTYSFLSQKHSINGRPYIITVCISSLISILLISGR